MLETILLATLIPIMYLVMTVLTGRMNYRRTKWDHLSSHRERQFLSMSAGLIWPVMFPGLWLMEMVTPPEIQREQRRKELETQNAQLEKALRVEKTVMELHAQGRHAEADAYQRSYKGEWL